MNTEKVTTHYITLKVEGDVDINNINTETFTALLFMDDDSYEEPVFSDFEIVPESIEITQEGDILKLIVKECSTCGYFLDPFDNGQRVLIAIIIDDTNIDKVISWEVGDQRNKIDLSFFNETCHEKW